MVAGVVMEDASLRFGIIYASKLIIGACHSGFGLLEKGSDVAVLSPEEL